MNSSEKMYVEDVWNVCEMFCPTAVCVAMSDILSLIIIIGYSYPCGQYCWVVVDVCGGCGGVWMLN